MIIGDRNGADYLPHNLDVSSARSIGWRNSFNHTYNVPLHHADVIIVVLASGHVAEVLDKVHDIGAVVHGVVTLLSSALIPFLCILPPRVRANLQQIET